ncbi:PRC-barrel domain-containing protein [Candidatus Woesearchaeota archaeon]|nr:PRC-barrel domain-containing protein [Candidatus Woesearchaeota archaeon]
MDEDKIFSKELIGKTVVSKNGKTYGSVQDVEFETRSGELINIILRGATSNAQKLELEKDTGGNLKIPFSAVIAVGDFLVVSEEDII